MSEETHFVPIRAVDGLVFVTLPGDLYMRMPPEKAREFANRLYTTAAKAEGKTGELVILVTEIDP